jgi:hypothetical protein
VEVWRGAIVRPLVSLVWNSRQTKTAHLYAAPNSVHTYSLSRALDGQEQLLRRRAADLDPGHDGGTLADKLADAGFSSGQIAELEEVVEEEVQRLAYHRAGEVLREIFARVAEVSAAGAALAYTLGLSENRSLSELGAQFQTSKQSIGNACRRLAPLLSGLSSSTAGTHALVRPSEPGVWLTLQEATKATGRSSQSIQNAGKEKKLNRIKSGARFYYDKDALKSWADGLTIDDARPVERRQQAPTQNSNPA